MNKIFKIIEIVWLLLASICLATCIYSIIIGEYRSAIYFLIFTLVSGLMYFIRKNQGKKLTGSQNQKEQKN